MLLFFFKGQRTLLSLCLEWTRHPFLDGCWLFFQEVLLGWLTFQVTIRSVLSHSHSTYRHSCPDVGVVCIVPLLIYLAHYFLLRQLQRNIRLLPTMATPQPFRVWLSHSSSGLLVFAGCWPSRSFPKNNWPNVHFRTSWQVLSLHHRVKQEGCNVIPRLNLKLCYVETTFQGGQLKAEKT